MTSHPTHQERSRSTWPSRPSPRMAVEAAELAARAAADPQRPTWHVTAPWGWLNDPNGLTVQPGPQGEPVLHLFYQLNARAPLHDLIQWGHAVSTDLVRWRDLPVALEPDAQGPDALGCWSGVIVNEARHGEDGPMTTGSPVMVYSGNAGLATQVACLAHPVPGDPWLTSWTKDAANPVIDAAPASTDDLEPTEMRDHCVWREDGRWLQVMGAGLRAEDNDGTAAGAALCFSSPDLRTWTFEGPLAVGDGDVEGTGTVWECPELVRLDGTDVLCVSAWHEGRTMRTAWMTGRRTGTRMEIGLSGRVDLGERFFYAPQSTWLPDGRRVMIGWVQPDGDQETRVAAGWAGSMSTPREVSLAPDGTLRLAPVREVETLRRTQVADTALVDAVPAASASGEPAPAVVHGRSLDLEVQVVVTQDAPLVLDLASSVDGGRRTRLTLSRREPTGLRGQDAWTGWLSLDRTASASPGAPWRGEDLGELCGPVPLDEDGGASVRILLDASSLEVFVDGQPLTARVGADPADDGVVVVAPGAGEGRLRAWEMGSAYPDGRLKPC